MNTPPPPSERSAFLAQKIETIFLEKVFHLLNEVKNNLEFIQINLLIPHNRSELYHNYNAMNHIKESPILKSLMSPFALSPELPPSMNILSPKSPTSNTNFVKFQKSSNSLNTFLNALQESNDSFFFSVREKISLLWNCEEPSMISQKDQQTPQPPSRQSFLSLLRMHKESLLVVKNERENLFIVQKKERRFERLLIPQALPFGDQDENTDSSESDSLESDSDTNQMTDIRITLLTRLSVLAFLQGNGRIDSRMSQIILKIRNWMNVSDEFWKFEVESKISPYFSEYYDCEPPPFDNELVIDDNSSSSINEKENPSNKGLKSIASLTGGLALGLAVGFTLTPLMPILVSSAIGVGFGAGGAGLVGSKLKNRYRDIKTFEFFPIQTSNTSTMTRIAIVVSGWIKEDGDYEIPWISLSESFETFSIISEKEEYQKLGKIIMNLIKSSAIGFATTNILSHVGLAAILTPLNIIQLGSLIDNPWSICNNLAFKQGDILADAIKKGLLGHKPITLVGYSLGALVIWSALLKICKEEEHYFKMMGKIENVCLFGLPNEIGPLEDWIRMRALISGRFIHGYADNDLVLRFIYRGAQMSTGQIAGLNPIIFSALDGLENVNMSSIIEGRHMEYPSKIRETLINLGIN